MLKTIFNYIWGSPNTELSLDDVYNVLETNDETSNVLTETCSKNRVNEFLCSQKTGTISAINGNIYTIDDTYTFKSTLKSLKIGLQVSFVVYASDGDIKVSNVAVFDDWQHQETETEKSWCHRCLICKVIRRNGSQIILTPNDITFDLNEVTIEFIPIIGDWLEIEAKVELDQHVLDLSGKILEIEKVRPLRFCIIEGVVKKWDQKIGIGVINRNVHFSDTAIVTGYIPIVGDKVIAEIIESDQGIYNRRATKLIPHQLTNKIFTEKCDEVPKFDTESKYVRMSDNFCITATNLGVSKKFEIKVENISEQVVMLSRIDLQKNSQCVITTPSVLTDVKIEPGYSVNFEGVCTIKNVGVTKELLIFYFDGFTLGRCITTCVEVERPQNNFSIKERSTCKTQFKNNSGNLIKGQRVSLPPRFITKRLPDYPIPQVLLDLAENYKSNELTDKISNFKPSLTYKLQYNIYEDRFHSLLHLEELAQLEAIKNYNQDLACFIKNGEFLMLEIENLAEKRPSLMVGDRIIAKNPYSVDAQEYEGYIHKTQANHVFLKFSPMFHEDYNGEDVSIMAIASRSAYRRMHQAVGQAVVNLRCDFLFPQKINTKNPQLDFLTAQQSHNVISWYNTSLNYYQKEAVQNVLLGMGRPLPYIIYGPPGTGKTVTLVEAILQILTLLPYSRMIVAAPSNSAANLVATRLINSGVLKPGDLIRLVGYQYFSQDLLPIELIPYAATADISKEGTYNRLFNHEEYKTPTGINSTAIGRHRITVATCSTIGILFTLGFPKGHFTHIIVDEAGQTTEPEIMIPLSLLDVSAGQVILAGDPNQLGPTVLSKMATTHGLEETYLERMLDRYPYLKDVDSFPKTKGYNPQFITKLVYNYRSLPNILELPSRMFYNSQLIATIDSVDSDEARLLEKLKTILPLRQDLKTPSIIFHGVLGENSRSSDSPSWFNANEASQIFYYVNELYRMGAKSTDIGIISPYVKQVKLIRSLLNEAEFDLPKLGTVEEFQGHECNVILLTTVRSCEDFLKHDTYFNLGFISNTKRLNVAITRARALLIIVGNPQLLMKDHHWRTIIKYCVDDGAYCGCDLQS
ncbi:hypothetical protein RN001_009422 [Aquatica leii]|uniref:RNA helicase n=1 Tax=Aquatica leii TaxID=1421715 RepID=A0AAN7S857_9COLE|nr:hypothetical protein RN001_009422 [Aquatica leii]